MQDNTEKQVQAAAAAKSSGSEKKPEAAKKKKKKKGMPFLLKVLMWIVIIAAAVFITLYAAAWIAGFDSVADLLGYLGLGASDIKNALDQNAPPSIR